MKLIKNIILVIIFLSISYWALLLYISLIEIIVNYFWYTDNEKDEIVLWIVWWSMFGSVLIYIIFGNSIKRIFATKNNKILYIINRIYENMKWLWLVKIWSNLDFQNKIEIEENKSNPNMEWLLLELCWWILKEKHYNELLDILFLYNKNIYLKIHKLISNGYYIKLNIIIWICYQEQWKIKLANQFFDSFLSEVTINPQDIQKDMDLESYKFLFLIKEIEELWFTYKVSDTDYQTIKNK
jgi:hypothetical protein